MPLPNLTIEGATPIAAWIPSLDDDGNGTTTLTDLTGNGYNGTLMSMDAATDWVSDTSNGGVRALDFDGVNDYVEINHDFINAFPFSFSLWMKPNVGSANYTGISLVINNADNTYYTIDTRSSQYAIIARNTTFQSATGGTSANTTWAHVVGVYAGNTDKRLYVNGSLVATLSTSVTMNSAVNRILLGRLRLVSSGAYLAGRLDDIRVFDDELTTDQISALYASGNGRGIVAASSSALLQILLAHGKMGPR